MKSLLRTAGALASACLLSHLSTASADVFVPSEELASDPTRSLILDPEYDDLQSRFCWIAEGSQDVDGDEKLWIGYIDPVTGLYDPPDGRGELVDQGLIVGVTKIGNGCEWVFTDKGPQIVYTKATGSTLRDRAIARAAVVNGQWVAGIMDNATASWGPIGSLDRGDPDPGVSYQKMLHPDVPGDLTRAVFVRSLDDPASEQMIPTTDELFTPGARWIPDTDSVIFTRPMPAGVVPTRQVFSYDRITDTLTQLTDDDGEKYAAFMWNAPEYGGEPIFLALINEDHLGIYRQINGVWTLYNVVDPPPPAPNFIWSPEPFVFEGKSYITMIMSPSSDQQSRTIPTEAWVAGIDPANPFFRRISDDRVLVRKDPENVILKGRPPLVVAGDTSDYMVTEALTVLSGSQIMAVGSSSTDPAGGRNSVFAFEIPQLQPNEVINRATVGFQLLSSSGAKLAGINADLWALSISSASAPIAYLEADTDPDSTHAKISDNLLTADTPTGQRVETASSESDKLATYLMSFYAQNPGYPGGAFLYLRLNPDQDTGTSDLGWGIASADNTTQPGPTLTLTITEARDVAGDPADYGLTENQKILNPANKLIQVGSAASQNPKVAGRNAILVIPLPVIAIDDVIQRATLSVYVQKTTAVSGFSGDLWMLGIGGPGMNYLDYLASDTDPNPEYVKISDNLLTASTLAGQRVAIPAGDAALLGEQLMAWYRSNPDYQGGAYLYLRLNPDADTGADTAGWTIRSADSPVDLQPGIRLTITPRDKPRVYLSVGGEIHRLETGLDTAAQ